MLNKIFSIKILKKYDQQNFLVKKHREITILGIKLKFKVNIPEEYTELYKLYLKNCNKIKSIHRGLNDYRFRAGYVNGKKFLSKELEINKKRNFSILYKNLDLEASQHLDEIIERNQKILNYKKHFNNLPLAHYIYNEKEMRDIYDAFDLEKNILLINDYYQWKNYKLPIRAFEASVFLGRHGIKNLKKNIGDGVIIDAGAYIGDSALIFREGFPDNKIISFEPENTNFNLLKKTIQLNNIKNIEIEKLALGESDSIGYIDNSTSNCGSQICNNGISQIKIISLDNYIKDKNIKISLIKTDLEGFEIKFLKGAKETIKTQKPTLIISIYHNKKDFFSIKPIVEKIAEEGGFKYKFDFFCGAYPRNCIIDCVLICEPFEN